MSFCPPDPVGDAVHHALNARKQVLNQTLKDMNGRSDPIAWGIKNMCLLELGHIDNVNMMRVRPPCL